MISHIVESELPLEDWDRVHPIEQRSPWRMTERAWEWFKCSVERLSEEPRWPAMTGNTLQEKKKNSEKEKWRNHLRLSTLKKHELFHITRAGKKLFKVSEMSHKILAQSVASGSTKAENSWHSWTFICRLEQESAWRHGAEMRGRPEWARTGCFISAAVKDRRLECLEHVWNTSGSEACSSVHVCDWIDIWCPPPTPPLPSFYFFCFVLFI